MPTHREMLQRKGAPYQVWGPLPWSLGSRCTSLLVSFLAEGTVLSQPPQRGSSAQETLLCWGAGCKHSLPPALPRCRSKVAHTSSTAKPRRKGVEAEKKGTGWLGWVRPPETQAWFADAAISCYQFPVTLAACRAVHGELRYRCAIRVLPRTDYVTDKWAQSNSQLLTE